MSKIKKKYLDFELYEQSEVDTISGALSSEIDSDITTHAGNASAHHAKYTTEEAQDDVGNIMSGAGSVNVTYTDETPTIVISGTEYTLESHNNDYHSETYITSAGVTYENLSTNSDIGTGSTQVSQGDHTHDNRYYTEAEITTISGNIVDQIPSDFYSQAEITTISGNIVDQIPSDFYTTGEVDALTWTESDITDLDKYTQAEVDTISGALNTKIDTKPYTLLELTDTPSSYEANKYLKSTDSGTEWSTVSGSGGVLDHSELNELDYVSSGHIGFQPVGDYVTDAEITTISGNIVDQIPTDFYTTGEVDTISGSLSAEIDSDIITLSGVLSAEIDSDLLDYLLIADIDDTPVDGITTAPISSNWAYDTTTNLLDTQLSPGVLTGGLISEGTVGTVTVSAITALLRTGTETTDPLVKVTLGEQANQVITTSGTKYYVGLDYNSNSPQILIQTGNFNRTTEIGLGTCMKDASDPVRVHFSNAGMRHQDGVSKLQRRATSLRRTELASGCAIGDVGGASRQFNIQKGVVYHGIYRLTPFDEAPYDPYISGDDGYFLIYGDTTAGFTISDGSDTVLNNTQYWNTTTHALATLSTTKYNCHWVYIHTDDQHVYVVLGTENARLAAAEQAQPPADLPIEITDFGLLLGCVIMQKSATAFTTIQMVTDTFFTGNAVADHGSLTGLEDDDHTDYHTDARGDARYYTETELDNGQLDNRYYTESEVDTISGTLNTKIDTTSGTLQANIDGLDYYTTGEVDTISGSLNDKIPSDFYSQAEITTISGNIVDQIPSDFYTTGEVDTISGSLNDKIPSDFYSQAEITTISGNIVDQIPSDFYTTGEVDTISGSLSAEIDSDISTHASSADHDGRYYTETEVDDLITTISGKLDDHNELNNLDYASSGHTGFQPAGDYVTDSEITTISGDITDQIPSLTGYATELYVDAADTTLSGILAAQIASVSGTTDHSALDNLDYVSAGHTGFQPAGDYITDVEMTTISGDIIAQIPSDFDDKYYTETELDNGQLDNRYYTESEVDTISGSLSSEIDASISDTAYNETTWSGVTDVAPSKNAVRDIIEVLDGGGTAINAALASNLTWTGPTQSVTAGEILTIGETAYLKSDGNYWLADAGAEATADTKLVMATATITASGTGVVLISNSESYIRVDATTEWTVTGAGDVMYLSTTEGELTNDVSAYTTGDIVRICGYMETDVILNFDVSKTFVEVA